MAAIFKLLRASAIERQRVIRHRVRGSGTQQRRGKVTLLRSRD